MYVSFIPVLDVCDNGQYGFCGGLIGLKCPEGYTCQYLPLGIQHGIGKCCKNEEGNILFQERFVIYYIIFLDMYMIIIFPFTSPLLQSAQYSCDNVGSAYMRECARQLVHSKMLVHAMSKYLT